MQDLGIKVEGCKRGVGMVGLGLELRWVVSGTIVRLAGWVGSG